jgi:hypothetical protein
MGKSLKIRKFDMTKVSDKSIIAFIGKRKSGKSTCLKELIYYKRHIPVATVVSPTEEFNKFFSDIIPPIFIHNEIAEEIIDNAVARQKLVKTKRLMEEKKYGSSTIDSQALLILDDCQFNPKWSFWKCIREIFMNGRHIDLTFIYTAQTATNLLPALRQQIDYCFLFTIPGIDNRKKLYCNYGSPFPTFECFNQIYESCTASYECLVIDNTVRSNKLEDQIAWYKADPAIFESNFQACAPEYWDLSKNQHEYVREEEDEENDDLDLSSVFGKRNVPQINIQKKYSY